MALNKILVLIPARYDSTRFPGKPLANILGKPMVQWVYERISQSEYYDIEVEVFVVTDNKKIKDVVHGFGGNVCLVTDETESGTERISLAVERFFSNKNYDLVINVQGDEPLIKSSIIEQLANYHLQSKFDIATVVRADIDVGENPNVVKAIYSKSSGRCLYFSRAEIPYDRQSLRENFYAHVGIYSFRFPALKSFCQFPVSEYERIESLEQLRALENGLTIGAIEVNERLQGVDTPEDIAKVEEQLNE